MPPWSVIRCWHPLWRRIEELEAGREVDKIYNTEENIYTYENAADYIDQRKY